MQEKDGSSIRQLRSGGEGERAETSGERREEVPERGGGSVACARYLERQTGPTDRPPGLRSQGVHCQYLAQTGQGGDQTRPGETQSAGKGFEGHARTEHRNGRENQVDPE